MRNIETRYRKRRKEIAKETKRTNMIENLRTNKKKEIKAIQEELLQELGGLMKFVFG